MNLVERDFYSMTHDDHKQGSLLDWYNARKRSTTIFINVGLIFLCISFIPNFIFEFPVLLRYLVSGIDTPRPLTLEFTYFFCFTFIYLGGAFLTYIIEVEDRELHDNSTFLIFSVFMSFILVALLSFGFLMISIFQEINF